MKSIRMKPFNFQRGFTAIETIVVLIVSVAAMSIGATYLATYSDNLVNQSAAEHAKSVADAANEYIKDNYAAVAAIATPTTPATITVAMLQSTNYLSSSFTANSPYGQSYSILALEPTAGKLQTLIVTSGGDTIAELNLRRTAQLIGAKGGYVSSTNTTVAQGSYGGWSMPLASYGVSPGAGHLALALFFQDDSQVSDYVYRNAVSGHPELNTMNTPLIMASTQTVGAACTTNGAIAQDGNGTVISCQSLTWQQQGSAYWKDPVVNFASLPTCNASSAWQTRIVRTPTTGTGPRAYTCDSTSWKALAVDDSGNMTVAGTVTVGKAQINDVVTENTACASNGLVARDATGLLLSCQSGVWVDLGNACSFWSGDLNWLEGTAGQSGCVNGSGLGNAPTGDWFFVEYNRHINAGNYYVSQRAVGMTGSAAGRTWTRSQQSGSAGSGWSAWMEPGSESGSLCGMMTNGGSNGTLCKGFNPWFSCPSGYSQHGWLVNFGDGTMRWCSKN